ncbi:hypothetical protein QFZ37_003305 [Chryseobacterium ginsenosidimutans]|uniref:plasmid mobilization protein n=1 Tax=Chryseobacterium ginsenosidimutans TaxID=687846 RepID=UPI0027874C62|nr:hypothetical protein [Chryseobacterium ginsenosidimutans]
MAFSNAYALLGIATYLDQSALSLLNGLVINENNNQKQNKGRRTPKTDPSIRRYFFRLTDEENAKLLSLFETSGMHNKSKFFISLMFSKEMKSVKIDKGRLIFICG